jgi:SHS2 domain-containing protein
VKYEYFDEIISDQIFRAYGSMLSEVFENAAMAIFGVIYDLEEIRIEDEVKVKAKGEDKELLLYDWLFNLIIEFEVEGVFFAEFSVELLKETKDNGFQMEGTAKGRRAVSAGS